MSEQDASTEPRAGGEGSVCPGCGRRFGCGAANGESDGEAHCWCMQQPVGLFTLEPGAGCYCPQCLEHGIAERQAVSGGA